ncbi:MAG: Gfo/Idh/MocA family oxidoreductase [Eubacteriales bacterium]|nr:Gfo/Idh/MocA family oxidoreductase [Eubacteriales bacterium]
MSADRLIFEEQGKPQQVLSRGMDYLDDLAKEDERLGALHFEGLPESWANLYTRFAIVMDAKNRGDGETIKNTIYPDIDAGIDGIRWINACAESADNGSVWTKF